MRKLYFVLFLFTLFLISACSTKHIVINPECHLAVISKNISSVNIAGIDNKGVDSSLLKEMRKHLQARLLNSGFDLDKDLEGMTLDVNVEKFSPGNAFIRLIIGLGAGRGSLIYTAKYISSEGKILAEMEGKERFTGGEAMTFNQEYGNFTTLGGADTVRKVLVQEAAKHIMELASLR